MPELNSDIPVFNCFVRREYLYDLKSHHGEYEECTVFGLTSIQGRALGFRILTERGAQISNLPVSALVLKQHVPHLPLHYLQMWDSFSYQFSITPFSWLSEMRCQVILRDRQIFDGRYYATVGWYGNNDSEEPGEAGLKDGHLVFLDCGCIACQPNSRIIFHEPSFITNPYRIREGERPDYLTQTYKFKCETDAKWTSEDSYRMFYDDHDLDVDFSNLSAEEKKELARRRALLEAGWDIEEPKK